jgi:hypothetical protein
MRHQTILNVDVFLMHSDAALLPTHNLSERLLTAFSAAFPTLQAANANPLYQAFQRG